MWLAIMGAEFVHGILRALLLEPYVGDFRSRQIGVFTGSVLILAIVRRLIRWIGTSSAAELMIAGTIWALLTVAFELGFGHYVLHEPWSRLAADYDLPRGGLLPLGLIVLALSPLAASRLTRRAVPNRSR